MNKKRPVNLDLWTIHFPITALASITHRVTGVVLLAGVLILMFMLDASLSSEESFDELQTMLANPLAKFIVWAVLAALAYHLVMGVRHLLMDLGIGESLEGGNRGATIGVVLATILMLAAGWLVW